MFLLLLVVFLSTLLYLLYAFGLENRWLILLVGIQLKLNVAVLKNKYGKLFFFFFKR